MYVCVCVPGCMRAGSPVARWDPPALYSQATAEGTVGAVAVPRYGLFGTAPLSLG